MVDTSLDLHPRPQLTRARWTDLGGPWRFAFDDQDEGLNHGWQQREDVFDRTITVPFPPESPASGIGDTAFHPVVWYARRFQSPAQEGERLILHCGAIDYRAQVWVNGQLVVSHEGGHTPFSADISDVLKAGPAEQLVVIRAEDRPDDLAQPRGKQDWRLHPHTIFYHRTTGIWQPIWLEPLAPVHITAVRWTPDPDRFVAGLDLALHRPATTAPVQVRVQLRLRDTLLADDTYQVAGNELHRQIALDLLERRPDVHDVLWSPEHPNLLDATLTLSVAGQVVDEVHSYLGMRRVGTGHGRFLLNGRPYYLRLALEQGYWPESHLAAPSAEALRREVELAKELGFNGVRIHQKVEDPRFLYWCDRLGLIVWGEMANAFVFSPLAVERLTREWLDVLARDYSHPCIVAWVPVNESWGTPNLQRDRSQRDFLRSLYHLTKALDPTRPVVDNDGWEHTATDLLTIHDYAFDGALLRARYGSAEAIAQLRYLSTGPHTVYAAERPQESAPLLITEFGGLSYRPAAGTEWFGYGTLTDAGSYLAKYRELVEAILACPPVAGFCYTQLTDTRQETNGLLTERREPKLDIQQVRAITSGQQQAKA
jgi:beta-galactosidase/beta-glucuronidase